MVLDGDNRVHLRNVQVGIRGTQLAEIQSGLSPGDRVILAAQGKYAENDSVTPVVANTPASETTPQSGGMIDMENPTTSGGGQ